MLGTEELVQGAEQGALDVPLVVCGAVGQSRIFLTKMLMYANRSELWRLIIGSQGKAYRTAFIGGGGWTETYSAR